MIHDGALGRKRDVRTGASRVPGGISCALSTPARSGEPPRRPARRGARAGHRSRSADGGSAVELPGQEL
ncbi:hypothetical protein N177_3762 [Lutibaculum baratangense AMV1]|uniref:Uncharacterized protein n=1 Tax=Lutibaculum baratangense AMV1 TaxID=631454 RepID=V4R8W1_9HYPH|nr:hypothetical protein N177_3762 [Lutibaculum baratangense AMV1]